MSDVRDDETAVDAVTGVAVLFEAHYVSIVGLAHLLLRDPSHAEDMAQDAFAALQVGWHRLDDPSKALDYVRSVVVNRCRSRIRSLGRRRRIDAQLPAPDLAAPSAEAEAGRNATHAELVTRVRALPRRQREVVVLRYWEGLSEQEIAGVLGISAGSVKTHASRALQALRITVGDER